MLTNSHISYQYARLQNEFNLERNNINTVFLTENSRALDLYNKTLETNRKNYNEALDKLTNRYNNLLKIIDSIIHTYRSTLLQLNYTYNDEIIQSLKNTIAELPDISTMCLNNQITVEDPPDYIHEIRISPTLAMYLVLSNIISPLETSEYFLKINSNTLNKYNNLKIHTRITYKTSARYLVVLAETLDMLIIQYNNPLEGILTVIIMRLTTLEHIIIKTTTDCKFIYYDNNIVCINTYYKLLNYYIFEPNSLKYNIVTYTYPSTLLDYDIIPYSNNTRTIYTVKSNCIYRITYNYISNKYNTIEEFINLDELKISVDFDYIKKSYELISIQVNMLTLSCVFTINYDEIYFKTIEKYIKIKLPYDCN